MSGEANTESRYVPPFPSLLLYQMLPEDPRDISYSCGPHQMTTYSTLPRVSFSPAPLALGPGEREGPPSLGSVPSSDPPQPLAASAKTSRLHLPIPGFQLLA